MRKGVDGPIKIGYTSTLPETRMAQLQTGHHEELFLLGTIPGTISEEKLLHKELERYSIRGEWFEPKPELLMAISDAIENKREWYYFRQVRTNLLDIENKSLKDHILKLEEKIKKREERMLFKYDKAIQKLQRRVAVLSARNKDLTAE